MKKQILLLPILTLVFMFTSCTDDSDPVNEQEVITTMTVTLTPDTGGTDVVLQTRDLDGVLKQYKTIENNLKQFIDEQVSSIL